MKATYNRLDWIAAKYIGSYVELTQEQQKVLRRQLAETLEWHRTTQLPAYAEWLARLQQDIPTSLSIDQVDEYGLELWVFWRSLMMRLADDMAVLLPRLTAEQRQTIFSRLEREHSVQKDEVAAVNLEKQQEHYVRRLEKGLSRWLGSLTEEQNRLIREAANQLQATESESLRIRVRFQHSIRALLERQANEEELRTALRSLLMNDTGHPNDVYEQKSESNRQVLTRLISELSSTLDKGQQEYIGQRINKYIRLFKDLARQGNQPLKQS
jgi:hypothetical protein